MPSSLAQRITLAHLGLSYRLGRKVTLAEFGDLIAREVGRDTPFTPAAVSRWESGVQVPNHRIIEAIAEVAGFDPGWISHGTKTAAPGPRAGEPSYPSPQESAIPAVTDLGRRERKRGRR